MVIKFVMILWLWYLDSASPPCICNDVTQTRNGYSAVRGFHIYKSIWTPRVPPRNTPKLLWCVVYFKWIGEKCKNSTGRISEGGGRILEGTGQLSHCQPVWVEPWTLVISERTALWAWVLNGHDPYAVAIVGLLPRTHSSTFWSFLWSGSITCRVTGTQRYSRDLEQGGLEISCALIFQGDSSWVES